ncbi:hypothetical protein, partial [Thermogutta sp.]
AIADAFDHATHPLAWAQPSPLIVLPTSEVADRTFDPRVLEVFRSHEDVFRKLTDQLRRMLPSDERWPVNPDGQLFGEWESAAGLNSDKSGAECLLE